jgi:hypothetical protein
MAKEEQPPSIETIALSYAFPDGSTGLRDVTLNLPPGSRALLIGGIYLHSPYIRVLRY